MPSIFSYRERNHESIVAFYKAKQRLKKANPFATSQAIAKLLKLEMRRN